MSPLISIVTITRNDLEGLRRTRNSLPPHGRDLYEWIIVDGASTDGTVEFLQSLECDIANWISEPDRGIYDAMNKGIARSVGAYCIFMNSGDEFSSPSVLDDVRAFLDGANDIVYGDGFEISEEAGSNYKAALPAKRYWYSMFTFHQAIFYNRAIINNGYDTSFRLAADWALTSKLIMGGAKSRYVGVPICCFHRGGSSDAKALRNVADKELWRIYREVHRRGFIVAALIFSSKWMANIIRFYLPNIYSIIRMRAPLKY